MTPVFFVASKKPSSSDQGSTPITLKRAFPFSGFILTRSIAPGVALWPLFIWAPSKAGPVGLDAASILPFPAKRISAFVPTSTTKFIPSAC